MKISIIATVFSFYIVVELAGAEVRTNLVANDYTANGIKLSIKYMTFNAQFVRKRLELTEELKATSRHELLN